MDRDNYLEQANEGRDWLVARWPDVVPALSAGRAEAVRGSPAVAAGLAWWRHLAAQAVQSPAPVPEYRGAADMEADGDAAAYDAEWDAYHAAEREWEATHLAVPAVVTLHSVEAWAREVLAAAGRAEGERAPRGAVRRKHGSICLTWDGTWTPGRSVEVTLHDDGRLTAAWDTATGGLSDFLRPERVLCFPGWGEPEVDTERYAAAVAAREAAEREHGHLNPDYRGGSGMEMPEPEAEHPDPRAVWGLIEAAAALGVRRGLIEAAVEVLDTPAVAAALATLAIVGGVQGGTRLAEQAAREAMRA